MAFILDIDPSGMFTANSLCLTVCPIHEWRLFFIIFKSNLSSYALWKTSSFAILSVHFIFNILLQHHVSNAFMTLSSFFPRVHVSDPQRATLQIQLCISFFFISKLKLFKHSSCFLLLNITLASLIRLYYVFIFPIFCNYTTVWYLNFDTCFKVLSSILILIFSKPLEQTITYVFSLLIFIL